MPTYNRQEYLAEAINGILGQTYKDFELIIVNDGGTDDTDILMDYFLGDKRVKYIKLSKNSGISAARNAGIKEAKGEYIMVADSDDLSSPDRMKLSLKGIKGHDFVYGIYGLGNDKLMVDNWVKPPDPVTFEDVKRNGSWPHLTLMARKECFKDGYRDDFKVNDDAWLVWQWFKRGYKAKFIEAPLAIQRGHAGNTSRTRQVEIAKTQKIMDKEYESWKK